MVHAADIPVPPKAPSICKHCTFYYDLDRLHTYGLVVDDPTERQKKVVVTYNDNTVLYDMAQLPLCIRTKREYVDFVEGVVKQDMLIRSCRTFNNDGKCPDHSDLRPEQPKPPKSTYYR